MFGKLLSEGVKIVTVPLDILNSGSDMLTSGDGSKRSRMGRDRYIPKPTRALEQLRDNVADTLESIDD